MAIKDLTHDKNGKLCGAKTAYMITIFVCQVKLLMSNMTIGDVVFGDVDIGGLSLFLGSVGAVYFGRSHTKAKE